jgi:hypothetical protein
LLRPFPQRLFTVIEGSSGDAQREASGDDPESVIAKTPR